MSEALHLKQFTHVRDTRSLQMRLMNAAGKLAPGYMRPNAEAWWEAAQSSIREEYPGRDIQPTDDAKAALDTLVDSINQSTRLNLVGRFSAFDDSRRMARNHLRIRAFVESHPEVFDTEIPDPVFVIGMPRTGTTYLHTLLAQDPRHRSIPYWESYEPVPAPNKPDQRIERLNKMLAGLDEVSPGYHAIHPMTAEMTEECVALFMNAFRTMQFDIQYRVPEYVSWLQGQDAEIAYRAYLEQLKIIQHLRPCGERFVLKDPAHTLHLPTILKVFPNARFVFTHRDPAKSISSICSLYAYTRAMFSDDVRPHAIGEEIINGFWPAGLEDAMRFRATLPKEKYADVRQMDMRHDAVDAVRRAYNELGIVFDDVAEQALLNRLEEESRQPRHRHEHSPEGFGLTAAGIRERMQGYIQDFDL